MISRGTSGPYRPGKKEATFGGAFKDKAAMQVRPPMEIPTFSATLAMVKVGQKKQEMTCVKTQSRKWSTMLTTETPCSLRGCIPFVGKGTSADGGVPGCADKGTTAIAPAADDPIGTRRATLKTILGGQQGS